VELPPAGTGGPTEFSDSRTACEELDAETKQQIEDKIAAHSIFQSRLVAAPYLKTFQMADPKDYSMGRHYIVQDHKPSGRKNLYVADDIHHIEGLEDSESKALIKKLMDHVKQEKYLLNVFYENVGDVAIWDNLAVLHRTGNGTFAGKFRRDLRRCICYDNTPEEWGLNDKNMVRLDAMAIYTKIHNEVMGGDAQTRLMNWD
jgi:alpha-ketoglutarate-dependent 2,4-dichlorophenoxyacetate dioxygenase